MVEERGEGGAELVILFLSDPGGKKGEDKKSCHVRIGSMLGSGGAGEQGRQGGGLEGAIIVIYIHTHARSQRVADG